MRGSAESPSQPSLEESTPRRWTTPTQDSPTTLDGVAWRAPGVLDWLQPPRVHPVLGCSSDFLMANE
jgi:hypothetical protein